jgi:transposase
MKPILVAGIDGHKAMLAVVIGGAGMAESTYERRKFGTSTAQIRANDLTLSFVSPAEQRIWRIWARTRVQLVHTQQQARNRLECILEEGQIKLSTVVSDLLGKTGRRILDALVQGEADPAALAALADRRIRATAAQLQECCEGRMLPAHRQILKLFLDQIDDLEKQIQQIDRQLAEAQQEHVGAIERLCQIPGIDVNAARLIVAEVGARAESFDTAAQLASWAGVCPGREESAGVSSSDAYAKGNRHLRRVLNQVAWAALRTKGSYFQLRFERWVVRLGPRKAAWAIAHKVLKLVWKVLKQGVRYQERGTLQQDAKAAKRLRLRYTAALRKLGYTVTLTPATPGPEVPA